MAKRLDRDKATGKTGARQARSEARPAGRPSREQLLSFIAGNPDSSGRRDIAKAFGLKGEDRLWLKQTLRDLADEGLLTRNRKRFVPPGGLPPVVVLDIIGRDADGGLLAHPAERDDDGEQNPLVALRTLTRRESSCRPGVGDRVLAKIVRHRRAQGPAYTARLLKLFDRRREAVLGVAQGRPRRHLAHRAGRAPSARTDHRPRAPQRRRRTATWSRSSRRGPAATDCRAARCSRCSVR